MVSGDKNDDGLGRGAEGATCRVHVGILIMLGVSLKDLGLTKLSKLLLCVFPGVN